MSHNVLVNTRDLSIAYTGNTVIEGISFSVAAGELLAVIGANGCGKSTLLNVLIAESRKDRDYLLRNDVIMSGHIDVAPGIVVAHLPQKLRKNDFQATASELSYEKVSIEARLQESFGHAGGLSMREHLSDGELQKAAVIRTLITDAELYLLDEPTNYLDIDGITAFEGYVAHLKAAGKALILVTHDRALTDNLADHTIFITANGIFHTVGGFQQAWSVKTSDFKSRRKKAGQIKRKIRQLQQDRQRKAGWADRKEKQKRGARRARAHISTLSKKLAKRAQVAGRKAEREMKQLRRTKPFVPKSVSLHFPPYKVNRRQVFALAEAGFHYENQQPNLLSAVTLTATTSDKFCLMGANGAGKSTIFKLITGQLEPTAGAFYLNEKVRLRYLAQGLEGFFNKERLLDNFAALGCDETTVRQYLGAALIRREKTKDLLGRFSQGELMRAAIVHCLLDRAEFLLLDEPTSHLDIESVEVLERLLESYQGGFLVISHDRTFVENVSERLYLLEAGRVRLV